MTKQEKLAKLIRYADELQRKLNGTLPTKHLKNATNFIQMLELDLKKTNSDIEKLRLK